MNIIVGQKCEVCQEDATTFNRDVTQFLKLDGVIDIIGSHLHFFCDEHKRDPHIERVYQKNGTHTKTPY